MVIHGGRRRLSRLFAVPEVSQSESAYYPQQPTCQIPDLWSLLSRFLGEREVGVFVEVGAYDGVFVSNTWGLAVRGWTGVLIEPVPHLADACQLNHQGHDVKVVRCAVGGADTNNVTLWMAGTLTTANDEVLAEYGEVDWASKSLTDEKLVVPCRTLDAILVDEKVPRGFDVLVVDVEGFERQVFSGFELREWMPKMMIIELADTHPDLRSTSLGDAHLGTEIINTGYRIVFKDRINTVFVRDDVWDSAYALP
jgi:FkbM family methyltransferase